MTGSWRKSKAPLAEKHAHITLQGPCEFLTYVDQRRFGHLYFFANKAELDKKLKVTVGVDLLSPDFTPEYILASIKKYPERAIKVHLMEQKIFAGTGNYICSEICARAGIRPTRKNKRITRAEVDKIHQATQVVIGGGIETGGTTFNGGYTDASGDPGDGVKHLVVFWQKICQLCGVTPVKKIFLANRGTYYCPQCQK